VKIPIGTAIIMEIKMAPTVKIRVFLKAGKTMVLISIPETVEVPNWKVNRRFKSSSNPLIPSPFPGKIPGMILKSKKRRAVTPMMSIMV